MDSVGQDGMLEDLNQNPPQTIDDLNLDAYNREQVAENAGRYFEVLNEPFTQEARDNFVQNIPLILMNFASYPIIWKKWSALTGSVPRNINNIFENAGSYVEMRATEGAHLVIDSKTLMIHHLGKV